MENSTVQTTTPMTATVEREDTNYFNDLGALIGKILGGIGALVVITMIYVLIRRYKCRRRKKEHLKKIQKQSSINTVSTRVDDRASDISTASNTVLTEEVQKPVCQFCSNHRCLESTRDYQTHIEREHPEHVYADLPRPSSNVYNDIDDKSVNYVSGRINVPQLCRDYENRLSVLNGYVSIA